TLGPPARGFQRLGLLQALRQRLLAELLELLLEVLRVGERLVDAREAQVRHRVEGLQALQHDGADLRRGHVGRVQRAQLLLDGVQEPHDLLSGDRPLLARLEDADLQLVAVEVLDAPVALDDAQVGPLVALVGREPLGARVALRTTRNGGEQLRSFLPFGSMHNIWWSRTGGPARSARSRAQADGHPASPGRLGAADAHEQATRSG